MTWNELLDASECVVQRGGPDFMMSVACTPFSDEHCLPHVSHNGSKSQSRLKRGEGSDEEVGTHLHKQVVQFLCHFCMSWKV